MDEAEEREERKTREDEIAAHAEIAATEMASSLLLLASGWSTTAPLRVGNGGAAAPASGRQASKLWEPTSGRHPRKICATTANHRARRIYAAASIDGGSLDAYIDEQLASGDVVVFSKTWCPYCAETKALLDAKGAPYSVVELDLRPDGAALQSALAARTGQRTVPSTFVRGAHVGGNDAVQAAARSGFLDALLAGEANAVAAAASGAPTAAPAGGAGNLGLALASVALAAALYVAQRTSPVDPLALLRRMEAASPPLPAALQSGKPTMVDFYAPWCESCRDMAPSMAKLERQYDGRVNFVVVNGDDARNAQLVRLFGVDAIPHIALISPTAPKGRQLQAVLVGDVPEPVLDADLRALADGEPPPWGRIAAPGPNE